MLSRTLPSFSARFSASSCATSPHKAALSSCSSVTRASSVITVARSPLTSANNLPIRPRSSMSGRLSKKSAVGGLHRDDESGPHPQRPKVCPGYDARGATRRFSLPFA